MDESVATALLVLVLLALFWVSARFARYRAIYRYAEPDLLEARRDAAKRSRGVRGGRAGEQLAPLVPDFYERFDPADARFLGAPVDYVVFDGLGAGELRELVLVEIKTGGGALNSNERQVERAVAEGRVAFELLRLP